MNYRFIRMSKNIRNNAPTVLTALGALGVIGTAILAADASPKALMLIEDARKEQEEPLSVVDTILVAVPAFMPTILMVTATITFIFGSNILNKKNQQTITNAYMMMHRSYSEYRKKIIELYGEETDRKIVDSITRTRENYHFQNIETTDDIFEFYEPISKKFFKMSEKELMDAEYHINRNYILGGCICVNDLLYFIGLPQITKGDEIGWDIGSEIFWIDFNHRKVERPDGSVYYSVDTPYGPEDIEQYR